MGSIRATMLDSEEEKDMVLYRYLPLKSALKTIQVAPLQRNTLRVGRIPELNDPFEFLPQTPPNLKPSGNRERLLAQIQHEFGIICFSEEACLSHPLMWSHYADKHQGLVLGFRFPQAQLLESSEDGLPRIEPNHLTAKKLFAGAVSYEDYQRTPPPFLDLPKGEDLTAAFYASVSSLTYKKSPHWSYEREWRCLVSLRHFRPADQHYLIRFEDAGVDLVSVNVGMKCPLDVAYFRALFPPEDYPQLALRKAHPSMNSFHVQLLEFEGPNKGTVMPIRQS